MPVLALLLFIPLLTHAQKYNFSHYDLENGLIQSQVNDLCLDNEHRLWVATFGGACRYDGREFVPWARQNGMPGNFVNTVFVDKSDNVWFGTQSGLSRLTNGKITTLKLPADIGIGRVRNVVQDSSGTIWAIINSRLFKVTGNSVSETLIRDTISMKGTLSCLFIHRSGRIMAALYRRGIYCLNHGRWIKIVGFPAANQDLYVLKIIADRNDPNKLYLLTYTGIYTIIDNKLGTFEPKVTASIKDYLLSMTQDNDNCFWLGTTNGVYYLKNGRLIHFGSRNGLTDNAVTDVYHDIDNNLWFATQGNGLFRYEGNHIITLDKSQGMPDNEVVMALTKDKNGGVIMGIDGAGLISFSGNKLSPMKIPGKDQQLQRVICLYKDSKGLIWIGTHAGLWSYNGKTFRPVEELGKYAVNGITEDSNGTLWVSAHDKCFYIENNKATELSSFTGLASSVIAAGRDSVMIGTDDGITLVANKHIERDFIIDAVKTSVVFCMLQYRNMIVIGTDDRGIFTWNRATGEVKNYGLKEGLNSTAVYSLAADDNGVIWAGTGRGVNRLLFNQNTDQFFVSNSGGSKTLIFEANQNAALFADHKIWIGTTRGAILYDPNSIGIPAAPPHVMIQSARIVPQVPSNSWENGALIANGQTLSHGDNHLAISFLGVYLNDPNGISYRYRLKGLDSGFSAPVKNSGVDYPSLPPGSYTFLVKAEAADGTPSANTASFAFTITPAFYQTLWFRIAGVVLLIFMGITLQNSRYRAKQKRQKAIEAARHEESQKIRQQTAEDFHDELGNKLTRITVLTEILDTKLNGVHGDQKKLLEQIRQNAASLYNGTKDVLWALNPQSDNLYEILTHIKDFGNELFTDTAISFEFNGIDESLSYIRLPMEYSRNIPMIFKELLNNVLKHAHADHVTLSLNNIDRSSIHLTLKDNGCGFEQAEARKGQGINNVNTRIKRIGGEMQIK
ncbi:MAG TPA: two-component regulator propeller domain-containing protein, partial [Mucilaginibacter sp.]|nr:two-component regulator propeller domain-containing protein [Mucilaginibacter sp.]